LININKKRIFDKNIYSIAMYIGRVPGMAIDLVLATDCEWTFVAGRNCSVDSGCSHGIYDHHMTTSEKVNWTITYAEVRRS
jgi:hypothetical protein